jgi:hypothetical protein
MGAVLDDILMHYGMPRRSGRYPWGSGKEPFQHSKDFLARVEELKKQNFTYYDEATKKTYKGDTAIAKYMGLSSTEFRVQRSLAEAERRNLLVAKAKSLQEDGLSLREIAAEMGYKNDSSVRALLDDKAESRMKAAQVTADHLKEIVNKSKYGMVDVGEASNKELGVSKEKMDQALYLLQREDYEVYVGGIPQATNPGQQTNVRVLCVPGTPHKAIYDYAKVEPIVDYAVSYDNGETFRKPFEYPSSMDSKRLQIRYAEDGGINKDGLIEIRPGCKDLDLGNSHYAQVRIMVDGTHYLKGMAVYSDNLPDGVDVLFNTNKTKDVSKMDVLKKIKKDPDNPFGSLIKEVGGQSYYDDPDGKYTDPATGKKQSLSLINKRAEEGDWGEWSDHLPSQFLSKQPLELAKKQLKLSEADKQEEYDTICSLTNPTIKKVLLKSFSEDCDSAAVHLQAAALPRQKYQVIMPLEKIKETEVYAPNYEDGEKVALIRYPHGSISEIPILTVNKKNAEGRKYLGTTPKDAIGISAKVAERLSGADFDGDTVVVIPLNSKVRIANKDQLEGLKGFDPKSDYKYDEVKTDKNGNEHYYRNGKEFKVMKNTQNEMGKISNLITDMTLKGANDTELAQAIRHSMVVIDAEKHKLDYQASYSINNIDALKRKYQKHEHDDGYGGASTLISKAKSKEVVTKRKGSPKIDPETGELIYKEVIEEYVDKKTGKTKIRTQDSTKMAERKDARELISEANTPMENLYADYANKMKSLANQARKEYISTPGLSYSPNARLVYATEVESLNAKLDLSERNRPRERRAQAIAASEVKAKKLANPDMSTKEIKKASQQALTRARAAMGAKRTAIDITDKEWEAIQAGAISDSKLLKILQYTDTDKLKERAMPRQTNALSQAKVNRIKAMQSSGYTTADIAKALGVSSTTVIKYMN